MTEPISISEATLRNPFVTLEALHEHIGALRALFGGVGRVEGMKPKIGTPAYHVEAAEDYAGYLFQALVVLLPEIWAEEDKDD